MALSAIEPSAKAATGIAGLDEILDGGLPREEMYMVRGSTGTGKTTLALQFLLDGAAKGEKVAFITLAQTKVALGKIAASHGWSLDGVEVCERSGMADLGDAEEQTLFRTADVELGETMGAILREIERIDPDRLVLDSVAQVRLLADTGLRYQRQLLALRDFFATRSITVLMVSGEDASQDEALADLAHGVIDLDRSAPEYGDVRRRLTVVKMRGMGFHGGHHNFRVRAGGLDVFPRLEPCGAYARDGKQMKSGVEGLDTLVGGGMEEGSACLIVGATGTGKTSMASLYVHAAAQRGERAAIFAFDERPETFFKRSEGLGMEMRSLAEDGLVSIKPISTAELSPGEFSQIVREAVEQGGAKVVLIDSLTGYFHAMPQEDALMSQMHDLLTYLSQKGVLSLLIVSQHGMVGETIQAPIDISYMADPVLLLRHFEALGSVRKAISAIKKRQGPHETTIRELLFAPGSLDVGKPIDEFTGVLSGQPTFRGLSKDVG